MPSTNFPKGLSVTTALHTVDGHILASTGSFSGLVTVGTLSAPVLSAGSINLTAGGTAGVNMIGERAYITGTFTSAAATQTYPIPFAGSIVGIVTVCDTTPRTCSAFTMRAGSDGTVGVASVALAFATAVGQQVSPALTAFTITTASALVITVTTAGSAANFGFTAILEKTA